MSRITSRRVISLPMSTRRGEFFSQNAAHGFEVWDAFDGRSGGGAERFDQRAFQDRVGTQALPGEIGCAISHLELVRAFATEAGDGGDALLVAEDDAILSSDLDAVLTRVMSVPGWDVAVLANPFEGFASPFWSKNRDRVSLSLASQFVGPRRRPWAYRLGSYAGDLWGAGLYVIRRDAARRLIRHADAQHLISWRADDYEAFHQAAGLDVFMLRPNLAAWSGGSEINPDSRPHLDGSEYKASRWGRQAWARRARRARQAVRATRRGPRRA